MLIRGPNLSGRSALLRDLVRQREQKEEVVGPEIERALTGLALTIKGELDLAVLPERRSAAPDLIERLGFAPGLERHPLTLSGGEAALLALISASLSATHSIGIDTVLEQLDPERRSRVLEAITDGFGSGLSGVVVDHRWSEWGDELSAFATRETSSTSRMPVIEPQWDGLEGHAEGPVALGCEGIEFGYTPGRAVLRGVSMELEPGRVYRLCGRNGSGKSTLARVLTGCVAPWSGRVLADGQEITPYRQPGRVCCYHAQDPDVQFFTTRVRGEVEHGTRAGTPGDRGAHRGALTESVLGAFGLDGNAGDHPMDLPYVLRKRLALACIFATRAPWLILDEPSLGQDEANCLSIASLVQQYANSGRGILFVTHSEWFASRLTHEELRLEAGVVVG